MKMTPNPLSFRISPQSIGLASNVWNEVPTFNHKPSVHEVDGKIGIVGTIRLDQDIGSEARIHILIKKNDNPEIASVGRER